MFAFNESPRKGRYRVQLNKIIYRQRTKLGKSLRFGKIPDARVESSQCGGELGPTGMSIGNSKNIPIGFSQLVSEQNWPA